MELAVLYHGVVNLLIISLTSLVQLLVYFTTLKYDLLCFF